MFCIVIFLLYSAGVALTQYIVHHLLLLANSLEVSCYSLVVLKKVKKGRSEIKVFNLKRKMLCEKTTLTVWAAVTKFGVGKTQISETSNKSKREWLN